MVSQMDANDGDIGSALPVPAAGSRDAFRVRFVPTSQDGRFGEFQLYVGGVPIGDGSTTAWYPHYMDFCRLCSLAEQPGIRERGPLHLGDTFDHLNMYVEMTEIDVVFTFTTRPRLEWGEPPPWAPPVGVWMRLSVPRLEFISIWRQAEPQFRSLTAGR
ncbi:hypothetical protein ACSNN9_07395 [Micromonospora sp. URMC 107]|uniref:hypothetical protein n=1 Tax=Micromonospora sp. URMC 107 TaxID=3423418 RepID=UPI003F195886